MEILKQEKCPVRIIEHCKAVAWLSRKIARRLKEQGANVDLRLVEVGALLHDIGRSKTHGVEHGIVGAKILRKRGVDERVIKIVEKHVGSGISKKEAKNAGLPEKDYIPESVEEKIVCYADCLIDETEGISFEEALERFEEWYEKGIINKDALKRLKKLRSRLNYP